MAGREDSSSQSAEARQIRTVLNIEIVHGFTFANSELCGDGDGCDEDEDEAQYEHAVHLEVVLTHPRHGQHDHALNDGLKLCLHWDRILSPVSLFPFTIAI